MLSVVLTCEACGWRTLCGVDAAAARLRKLGLLRRAPHPPEEMVDELLKANHLRLACDGCGRVGLLFAPADEFGDDADWQRAIVCVVCREPIPPERVEIFPQTRRCVASQDVADRGLEPEEPEFCPKCGALVELRVSQGGGITRYRRCCTGNPPCRLG